MPSLLATVYSKALFNLEASEEVLNERLYALIRFQKLLKENKEVRRFFFSPDIPLLKKQEIVEKGLSKTQDKIFINFLKVLLDKGHIKDLVEITDSYKELVYQKMNIIEAKIKTPFSLDENEKKKIKESLENKFKKEIQLNEVIDPDLIGGFTLLVNNQLMDFSLSGKLNKLKEDLLAINLHRKETACD